jgi:hypothetical protein
MNFTLAYRGRSDVARTATGLAVTLAPNLRRDLVSFEGVLRQPLRFREAIGALHDVVISDFKFKPKDKTDYQAYVASEQKRLAALRQDVTREARRQAFEHRPSISPVALAELERSYNKKRKTYWDARLKYSNYLYQNDRELWRLLLPCDPVITVAPDCLFFECFSADESSYGCLTVDRGAFFAERDVALGTTNVDYSLSLYEHFQALRSYRETRFLIDPTGFEVKQAEGDGYREEKIDLPQSWLKGFMRLQSAMSLPLRRVPISREGLYNILAFLQRHRAARSPRAVRFELEPGQQVAIVLEPWERRIVLHGQVYEGSRPEVIRTWGRDRLRLLARLLPLMDDAEVYLLGSGLPSFWSIRMGELRLLLGLSGWTANDWTGGSTLAALAPPGEPSATLLGDIGRTFLDSPAQTLATICMKTGAAAPYVAAGLNRLAGLGQVIHDLHAGIYRWRQVMPVALSAEQLGPDDAETLGAADLIARKLVKISRDERRPDGLHLLEASVLDRPVTLVLDADGRILRGKCTCSHHFKAGLRNGPCRHLQALRQQSLGQAGATSLEAWYASLER